MKKYRLLSGALAIMSLVSCKSDAQKQKDELIESHIVSMRQEMDSIRVGASKVEDKLDQNNQQADQIIGVWEVKNEYHMGIYEIEKYKGTYVGKIHYYNDGTKEYRGNNAKSDYFLTDVIYEDGVYKNGKLFMPDGSYYQVLISLKNNDELEIQMTVDGEPYTEIWKRQKTTEK
ncbi:DUF2147 domain-containing protein [Winogradskyella sp.]|uniref:DUF2147 domain-containing protein n=1 Tax=Winogradskyella sp. TaxID=1883156 RepID=UPI00262EF166|nr:DUF2147 domain-containing protein [Winogradskyella sp.]